MSVAIQKLVTSDTERYRNTVFFSNAQAKEKQKTKKKRRRL